jgi:hypothetical protein
MAPVLHQHCNYDPCSAPFTIATCTHGHLSVHLGVFDLENLGKAPKTHSRWTAYEFALVSAALKGVSSNRRAFDEQSQQDLLKPEHDQETVVERQGWGTKKQTSRFDVCRWQNSFR